MRIQNAPKIQQPTALKNKGGNPPTPPQAPTPQKTVLEFYEKYEPHVRITGGALVGAGLAKMCGLPSAAILAAAGSGAVVGWLFANTPRNVAMIASGATVGAGLATIAGLPGAGVMAAAGAGAVGFWLFG